MLYIDLFEYCQLKQFSLKSSQIYSRGNLLDVWITCTFNQTSIYAEAESLMNIYGGE